MVNRYWSFLGQLATKDEPLGLIMLPTLSVICFLRIAVAEDIFGNFE